MDFTNFTPGAASLGGLLIGASGLILFALLGRQAGVSSVAGGLMRLDLRDLDWRIAFLGGIIVGPLVVSFVRGAAIPFEITLNPWMLVIAGLLVGFGTRLGNGCTSGHGICGVSRLSVRSIVAVVTFVCVGVVATTLARLGGLS
ncbi:YeeE/YedE family protein [Alphaproteobacteria bacterium]|nr:YeeE/YedE family protein [Alphaproteobacteria bacterium]